MHVWQPCAENLDTHYEFAYPVSSIYDQHTVYINTNELHYVMCVYTGPHDVVCVRMSFHVLSVHRFGACYTCARIHTLWCAWKCVFTFTHTKGSFEKTPFGPAYRCLPRQVLAREICRVSVVLIILTWLLTAVCQNRIKGVY